MCNNISTLRGCGNCIFSVLDKQLSRHLDLLTITRLCSALLYQKEADNTDEGQIILSSTLITCNGNILLDRKNTKDIHNRKICSTLLQNWYLQHKEDEGRLPYIALSNTSEKLKSTLAIQNLRTEALKLAKYTEMITVCNGCCTEIITNKEISSCRFTLQRLMRNMLCDSACLLHILNMILDSLINLNNKEISINPERLFVLCNGTILLDKAFKKVPSGIDDIKKISLLLLESWCNKNIYKTKESNIIRDIMILFRESESLVELYTIVSGMLR